MSEASVNIEQDHFPQVADKASLRVEILGLKDKLGNSHARREFFGAASDEQYKKMLGYINSVTRKQPINYDYQNGQVPSLETPPMEDKEPLMNLTFEAVRNILSDGSLDDRTALRLTGLTLAGAISYIHPYENGNGRVGRVMHYLMEFGTERGEKAFNEELYAIIAKAKMYDIDKTTALYDKLPPELENSLTIAVKNAGYLEGNPASQRVKTFLQMMQGSIAVPIQEKVSRTNFITGVVETVPPEGIDGKGLFIRDYLNLSSIPYRKPDEMPQGAHRVLAQKSDTLVISGFLDMVE